MREKITYPAEGVYVVAVSGGIDSVVLLDVLAQRPGLKLVVAHFDHGIRDDSPQDVQFVASLAAQYDCEYYSERGELGSGADEASAREARYAFLKRVKDRARAQALVTAHHQDDIIETMIINLFRGTGWRGLCSLRSTEEIIRPLLAITKEDIKTYAQAHQLAWREDSTNQSDQYLRNRVRNYVMPHTDTTAWMALYTQQMTLLEQINDEVNRLMTDSRYFMTMVPREVATELLRAQAPLTRPQAQRALHNIKTGKSGASFDVGGGYKIELEARRYIFHPAT